MHRAIGLAIVPALVAGWIQACGGSQKPAGGVPHLASSAGPSQPAAAGRPVENEQGVQVAVSDQPSSSGTDVDRTARPKLDPAAKQTYMQALEAFGKGDLQSAKKLFEQVLAKDPKSYQAHYSLGVVLERMGDPDALSHYRKAFSIVNDYEPAIVAYALLMARKGELGEAESFLLEKHAKMPKSAAVTAALAEVKSMQHDTGTAQQLAQKALKLNPNYAPAMVVLARDHYRNRRLDLAGYALKAILDGFGPNNPPRDKNNAEAHLLRALILKERGLRSQAIKELQETLKRRPDMVDAGVLLGTYYLEAGNPEAARPLLERALKYNANNLVAHLNLGDCYRLLHRPQDAKREFEWVLAHDKSRIEVYYDLGLLYLFTDSYPGMTPIQQAEAALEQFEKYKKLRGNRGGSGRGKDVDELISRAKAKKAVLEAEANANKPAAPAPPPPASASAGQGASPGASAAPAGSAAAGGN